MIRLNSSLRFALSVTTALSFALPAFAQDETSVTPPTRVGQIADVSGSVSYEGAGSNGQWVAATSNYPVTTGDSLFTQDGAEAALVLNASRMTLGPNTEIQVTQLDYNNFAATQSQGEVFLDLTDLQPGQSFTINTPRGAVSINGNGEYDIVAGDANDPTTIAVLSGSATSGQLQIPAGQEAYLSGTAQTTAQLGPLQRDDFTQHVLAEMSPPPPPYAAPVVAQMTGVDELSAYGSWQDSPEYGAVWYPSVGSGWAPYREGHWAYIAPWGWTWVDSDPWGFAPFHYGRWIQDGGRWGWVPAGYGGGYTAVYQPVYAPAVVTFFGIGAGVAITAAILSSGSVGWVPLAPNEPYYPPYHCNDAYLQRINRVDVHDYRQININNIHNTVIINHYVNRGAATYIPAADMARGARVADYGHPVPAKMFADAHPMHGEINQALKPHFEPHRAAAPHPPAFAMRHNPPPMVISHAPVQMHPGGMMHPPGHPENAQGLHPGMGQTPHPENAHPENAPGLHPGMGQPPHPGNAHPPGHPENAPGFHPGMGQPPHPENAHSPGHPENAPGFHPGMGQPPHPETAHPAAPFHPETMPQVHHEAPPPMPHVEAPHPAAPAFHPPAPAFHPPAPSFHPGPAPHPEPAHREPPPGHHPQ